MENIIKFLDLYNLPWLLLALLTWLIIFFTCSSRQFLHGLPVGIWTMAVGGILEAFFIEHKFWIQRFILIHVGELDLFVLIGPFFAVGLLLIRFLPSTPWGKSIIVLGFSALATLIELAAIKLHFLSYHESKWGWIYSMVAYCIGLTSALGFYYIYRHREN